MVTGGAGFIGSAFIRHALPFVEKIVNLDLLTYAADQENVASIANDPRYLFVKGDICDGPLLFSLCQQHQIDAIVHCAAETHVDRSIDDPALFIESNIRGTFSLLEVVRRLPHIHFHHVSTDEVYGSISLGAFNENSPYCPNSPYAASKAASDHLVRAWGHTYNLSTTISHCTNNFGPHQYVEKFIPNMILCCLQNKPLPVYGQGINVRDWLYVDDHAEAIWTILQKGKRAEIYDISARCERRNIDVAYEIAALLHLSPQIQFVPDRPGHDLRYALDPSKIETKLGWRPRHTFSDALKQTINWYHENYRLSHSCQT